MNELERQVKEFLEVILKDKPSDIFVEEVLTILEKYVD